MATSGSSPDQLKMAAAEAAVAQLQDGMVVGLGTGSTSKLAVDVVGRRVAAGLKISGIPTSERTAQQARDLGIPLTTFAENNKLDVAIDGADEVELGALNLIKGLGGALLREKIVVGSSARFLVMVDESKLVERLGLRTPVPVEVVPFGYEVTARKLRELGGNPVLRPGPGGKPYLTDGRNYILDTKFDGIPDPAALDRQLNSVVGVVEHGLFVGMTSQVIIGTESGVRILNSGA
jgi:ribose 5-phosphate isomerase A